MSADDRTIGRSGNRTIREPDGRRAPITNASRFPAVLVILLLTAWLAAAPTAWQTGATPQTFRTDVDLLQLDITVLDAKRRPVGGLTAKDFTVLVDGKARPIVALTEVKVPARPPVTAAWMNDVAPDAVSNTMSDTGRAVMIVVDPRWPNPINVFAQRIARAAVAQLGPGDLAALLYTLNVPRVTQGFTNDRPRLASAIEQMPMAIGEDDPEVAAQCYCGTCPHETIARAADAVRDLHRQKTMLVIGVQITLQATGPCFPFIKAAREKMFAALDRSNVVLYYLDPVGLRTLAPSAATRGVPSLGAQAAARAGEMIRAGNLRMVTERTGGRSIGSNSAELELPGIFSESTSYYLAGIEPPAPRKDGRDVKIEVKARQTGLVVNARKSYAPPTATSTAANSTLPADVPASLWQELAGTWASSQRQLTVTATPLGLLPSGQTAVAVVVEGHWTASASRPGGATSDKPGTVEVIAGSFDRDGKSLATHYQTVPLPETVAMRPNGDFEILSRLVVGPGPQEVRVALRPSGGGPAGSVYSDLLVPDFKSDQLSLSGIALAAGPGAISAASNLLQDLLPFAPTARRTFARRDEVSGLIRVFERASDPPGNVELSTRIVGDDNQPAFDQATTLQAAEFESGRSVEHRFDLPVGTLRPGEYLLTIEVVRGEHRAKRQLRFRVE